MTQAQFITLAAIAYLAIALTAIRLIYVQVVDLNVERGTQAKLTATMSGAVWPATLVIVALWYLGNGFLFRETPGERKRQAEAKKHGKGVW